MKSINQTIEALSQTRAQLYTVAAEEYDRTNNAAIYKAIDSLTASIKELESMIVPQISQLAIDVEAELAI